MGLITVYKCLCDLQRLRILNLLKEGPLCVCHLQELLEETQVKMSTQLAYMRKLGLVQSQREGTWMIYSLVEPVHPLLSANLACLQDCAQEHPEFASDLRRRADVLQRVARETATPEAVKICCAGGQECC